MGSAAVRYIDMNKFEKAAPQIRAALADLTMLINKVQSEVTVTKKGISAASTPNKSAPTANSLNITDLVNLLNQVFFADLPIVVNSIGTQIKISLLYDETLTIGSNGKLTSTGVVPGSNNTLKFISDDNGASVKLQRSNNGGTTWSDTGNQWS
jgi:hypothetical protein